MTEQQACTLCGAGGHTAAQCNWNKATEAKISQVGETFGEIGADGWRKISKPAMVGAVSFGVGISSRLVVEAAQRYHEYSQEPAVEAERMQRISNFEELPEQAEGAQGGREAFEAWAIDHTAGRPILTYEGCSVIQDETAYEVLALIQARAALAQPSHELESKLLDASAERNDMQRQRDALTKAFERECDDADALLRLMGLEPQQYRTEGGSINLSKVRTAQPSPAPEGYRGIAGCLIDAAKNGHLDGWGVSREEWYAAARMLSSVQPSPAPELRAAIIEELNHVYRERKTFDEAADAILAQHDRIVRAHAGAIRLLADSVARLRAECNAAQVRVAELEKQEPVHWRALLDPDEIPQQLNRHMHIVGFVTQRAAEYWIAAQLDFDGWHYTLQPLYAAPVAQAGQAGQAGQVPDGWKLVPIEPTEQILDEFDSIVDYGAEDSKDAWRRLLAAAPAQGD